MLDLRAVYIRDTVLLQNVQLAVTLRVPAPEGVSVTSITVDDIDVPFFPVSDGTILLSRPTGSTKQGGWSIRASGTDVSGNAAVMLYDQQNVVQLAPSLRITVENTAGVHSVLFNRRPVGFTVVSKTMLLCEVPREDKELRSLDVVTTLPAINRTSFFDFTLPVNAVANTGRQKLIAQFVKLLLSGQGTNLLHQQEGGGLRQLARGAVVTDNMASIVSEIARVVASVTIQMFSGSGMTRLPPDERFLAASITDIARDPNDPTVIGVGLRIITFDQVATEFSVALNSGSQVA